MSLAPQYQLHWMKGFKCPSMLSPNMNCRTSNPGKSDGEIMSKWVAKPPIMWWWVAGNSRNILIKTSCGRIAHPHQIHLDQTILCTDEGWFGEAVSSYTICSDCFKNKWTGCWDLTDSLSLHLFSVNFGIGNMKRNWNWTILLGVLNWCRRKIKSIKVWSELSWHAIKFWKILSSCSNR